MENKNAEIITIGEEYPRREAAGTAADVIAAFLCDIGIVQKSRYYVARDEEEIHAALCESMERYDVTFITGNFVDFPVLTANALARILGVNTVGNAPLYSCMKSYAKKHDAVLSESAQDLTIVPKGAEPLICESVPISGYTCEKDGKLAVVLPGSPDFISLICEQCLALFFESYREDRTAERKINLIGCKMPQVVAQGRILEKKYPEVSISISQPTAEITFAVSVPGAGMARASELLDKVTKDITEGELAEYVYGVDTDLQTEIVRRLTERKQTVATAESCTGGLIAKLITDVPGSSAVFPGGVVSYSNEIKRNFLGVKEETLMEYGAVSHKVAIQMAEGVRHKMGANWGIGITGIAGPGGGSPEKPVGLVYLAISSRARSKVLKFNIEGNRENVRSAVAKYALRELLIRLMSSKKRRSESASEEE